MKRREFIKSTGAASGALAAAPYVLANESWKGANDRVNVAVIGIHGMGQYHVTAFHELENVRVAALCDVDESLFEERVQKLYRDPGLLEPKIYTDLRRLYEDRDIDAVLLDFTMAGMDGMSAYRRLRVIRSDIPVILSSGRDPHEIEGKEACSMCHSGAMEGMPAAPASHEGLKDKACVMCHAPAG